MRRAAMKSCSPAVKRSSRWCNAAMKKISDIQKKKRITLLAGYDKQSIVQDYVVYLAKSLAEFSDVYYTCDNKLSEKEIAKIKPYTKNIWHQSHGMYDFGSWKIMIQELGWDFISQYDEMLIINDSCYGPLYDLKPILDEMSDRDCDFWGITSNTETKYHIQSYFVLFKKSVMKNDFFKNFWEIVTIQKSQRDIINKYEIELTQKLLKIGFKSDTITKTKYKRNPTKYPMTLLKKYKCPFLKIKCFTFPEENLFECISDFKHEINNKTNYNVNFILDHIKEKYLNINKYDSFYFEKNSYAELSKFGIETTRKNNLKLSIFGYKFFVCRLPGRIILKISKFIHENYME
jgi:lipopolysaccharide biosynthesis protein